ncbi:PIR Superfamily Protein [Plasmodium ovale wallikeri]|uniref:PIR Superfamily Protein n=1 Tax=Plasmodium ovale wallikeri TaxID=864142 RepID=A0A1A9AMG6_PLAOA|nr:PIR Superfamily Protein [Plasmodium ovale wallikeri]SBT57590.1 PIR Superfamily Protein [Plasmodium ovale wallikeri]
MKDSYEYGLVKKFHEYKHKLEELGKNINVNVENDDIVTKCKQNADIKLHNGFNNTQLCIQLNKYIKYHSDKKVMEVPCLYLNYWLNNKRIENPTNEVYKKILNEGILFKIFNNSIINMEEYVSRLNNIPDEITKRIGTLLKLDEEYNSFVHNKLTSYYRYYCDNANKFANIYNKAIDECFDKPFNRYCKEIKILKEKFQYHKPKEWCSYLPDLKQEPEIYRGKMAVYEKEHFSMSPYVSYDNGNTGALVGKIIGGLVVFLLLYRFTPLSSLLNFAKRKKKQDFDNQGDGTFDYYSYNYGNEEGTQGNRGYNLLYNSSQDSDYNYNNDYNNDYSNNSDYNYNDDYNYNRGYNNNRDYSYNNDYNYDNSYNNDYGYNTE